MNYKIKDLVKDNYVEFHEYRQGIAYYFINFEEDRCGYFPVPLEDIGDATLKSMDKAIFFMRYIRKALEDGTFIVK